MNPLFWLILVAVVIAAAVHAWLLRSRNGERDGGLELGPANGDGWSLEGQELSVLGTDVLSTRDRSRVILRVQLSDWDKKARRRALKAAGRQLFRHTEADALLVEAQGPEGQRELFLFAPDGRGWWGREALTEAFHETVPNRRAPKKGSG